ncbi:MAG: hypothetical protein V3571_05285 [Pseudodesulfovibrio sp.]
MRAGARTGFNTLLQRGFYLAGRSGMTVREFLREVVGYDDARIDRDVRTVFLNSSPMDGLDETMVRDGDRLALGSAMPGLVGICMGRDNPYKEFRKSLALERTADDEKGAPVRVYVKIFSVLAVDTGADILARGVEVDRESLVALLEREKENILSEAGRSPDRVIESVKKGTGPLCLAVRFV